MYTNEIKFKLNILMFYYSRRKRLILLWPHVVLLCIKMQHVCLFYTAINNQTPSLRLDVSLLRDNINIFIMFHIVVLYNKKIENG